MRVVIKGSGGMKGCGRGSAGRSFWCSSAFRASGGGGGSEGNLNRRGGGMVELADHGGAKGSFCFFSLFLHGRPLPSFLLMSLLLDHFYQLDLVVVFL
jgi:hypothetical protein